MTTINSEAVERITESVVREVWSLPGPSKPVVESVRKGVLAALTAPTPADDVVERTLQRLGVLGLMYPVEARKTFVDADGEWQIGDAARSSADLIASQQARIVAAIEAYKANDTVALDEAIAALTDTTKDAAHDRP